MTTIPAMTLRKAVYATTWGDTAETHMNNRYSSPISYEYFSPPGVMRVYEESKRSFTIVTNAEREALHDNEFVQQEMDMIKFTGSGSDAAGAIVRIYITNTDGTTKVTKITFNRVSA